MHSFLNILVLLIVLTSLVGCSTIMGSNSGIDALDHLKKIHKDLAINNSRYSYLVSKSKNNSISDEEKLELSAIFDKKSSEYFTRLALKKIKRNKDQYKLIAFDNSECKNCYIANSVIQEIAESFNIKLQIINTEEFTEYINSNDLQNDFASQAWLQLFSDKDYLLTAIKGNGLPIMLHDKTNGNIFVQGRTSDLDNQYLLKSNIAQDVLYAR